MILMMAFAAASIASAAVKKWVLNRDNQKLLREYEGFTLFEVNIFGSGEWLIGRAFLDIFCPLHSSSAVLKLDEMGIFEDVLHNT